MTESSMVVIMVYLLFCTKPLSKPVIIDIQVNINWIEKKPRCFHFKTERSLEGHPPSEQDSKSPWMGKWSCRYTSTGQDGFSELDLEWIGPVVAELSGRTNERRQFHNPLFSLRKGRGTKYLWYYDQKSFHHLHLGVSESMSFYCTRW